MSKKQFITEYNLAQPFKLLEMSEMEFDGKKFAVARGEFQSADEKNGNGRVYPEKILEREIGRLASRISKNETSTYMLADHPPDGVSKLKDVAGIIQDISYDRATKKVLGSIRILGTHAGNNLKEVFRGGGVVGISARGFGSMKPGKFNGEEADIVQENWSLQAYDFVLGQSHKGAIASNFMEQNEGEEDDMDIKEFFKSLTLDDLRKERPELATQIETAAVTKEGTRLAAEATQKVTQLVAEEAKAIEARLQKEWEKKVEEAKAKAASGEPDIDEAKLIAAAKKLDFRVIKGGKKTETEERLETQLTEVKTELSSTKTRLDEMDKNSNLTGLVNHIEEKSKGFRFRSALITRLKENCSTPKEVDDKIEEHKKTILEHFGEGANGKGHAASKEPSGDSITEGTKEVTLSSGLKRKFTSEQIRQRQQANLPV